MECADALLLCVVCVCCVFGSAWFAREIFVELFYNKRDQKVFPTLESWAAEWVDIKQQKDAAEIAREAERAAAKAKKAAERLAQVTAIANNTAPTIDYVEVDLAKAGLTRYSDRRIIPGGHASADTYHHTKNPDSGERTNFMPASAFHVPSVQVWKSTKARNHWLQFDLPIPVRVSAYSWRSRPDGACRAEMPKAWKFQAKRHASDKEWIVLHEVSAEPEWIYHPATHRGRGIMRVYNLSASVAAEEYRVFRWSFTRGLSNQTGEYSLAISDVGLWGPPLTASQLATIDRARMLCGLVPSTDDGDLSDTRDLSGSGKPYGGERCGDDDVTALAWSNVAADSFYDTRSRYNDEYAMDEFKAFSEGWLYKCTFHSRIGPSHWLLYDAPGPIVLTGYSMRARPDRHARVQSPHAWTIQARNTLATASSGGSGGSGGVTPSSDPVADSASWTVIERVKSQPDWDYASSERDTVPGELRTYDIAPPTDPNALRGFNQFRWSFTRNSKQDNSTFYTTLSAVRLIGHTEYQERTLAAALASCFATGGNGNDLIATAAAPASDSQQQIQSIVRVVFIYLFRYSVLIR